MRSILRLFLVGLCFAMAGGPGAPPASAGPLRRLPSGIELSVGARHLPDDDMRETYGLITVFGLRVYAPSRSLTQCFADFGFSQTKGNPFYHLPASEMGHPSRLTVKSLEVGVRGTGRRPASRGRIFLGASAGYTEVEERVVGGDVDRAASSSKSLSRVIGVRLLGGPEWEFAPGRWSAGVEASVEMLNLKLDSGPGFWTIPLWGGVVRASLARRL